MTPEQLIDNHFQGRPERDPSQRDPFANMAENAPEPRPNWATDSAGIFRPLAAGAETPLYRMGVDPYANPRKRNIIRDIKIVEVDHGYVVTVGCKTLAFDSSTNLLTMLKVYMNDPNKTEESFEQGLLIFPK